jgi:hypothetical protein
MFVLLILVVLLSHCLNFVFIILYEALPEGDADEVDSDDEDEGDDENKLLRYDTFIKPHIFVLYIQ